MREGFSVQFLNEVFAEPKSPYLFFIILRARMAYFSGRQSTLAAKSDDLKLSFRQKLVFPVAGIGHSSIFAVFLVFTDLLRKLMNTKQFLT